MNIFKSAFWFIIAGIFLFIESVPSNYILSFVFTCIGYLYIYKYFKEDN